MDLYVIPESLTQRGNLVTGKLGKEDGTPLLYKDNPIIFTFDIVSRDDIIIPENLETIYPLIEDAVIRYFSGKN